MNKNYFLLILFSVTIFSGCSSSLVADFGNSLTQEPASESETNIIPAVTIDPEFPPLDQITPDPNLSLEVAESRLLGAYLDTDYGGYWMAKQGEKAIPIIEEMLGKIDYYREQHKQGTMLMGTFPYNAVYALAQIDSPKSKLALENCIKNNYSEDCLLALKAWEYRNDHPDNQNRGQLARFDMKVYAKASESAQIVSQLNEGTKVLILEEVILNDNEAGFRGGPMMYMKVKLMDSGEEGYVQRHNDSIYQFI